MSRFDLAPLLRYAQENEITLPDTAAEQLTVYGERLLEWNESINLTAITEPQEIVVKHFIDSLSVLKAMRPAAQDTLLDVGSGAGFPGMVIRIACPWLPVTLMDGHAKRFAFLSALEQELGLQTVHLHLRAELAGTNEQYRERFSLVTARAVARLSPLCEYCLPLVAKGGRFFAMKGPEAAAEVNEAAAAVKTLGGKTQAVLEECLPDGSQRCIVVLKKISQTPTKYPRASAKITKQPL